MKLFSSLLILAVSAAALTPDDFEIKELPGLKEELSFKQYSGLMPIGDEHNTSLFFWFVESQKAPTTDPVVFWTNGGPGSSSVAYGFWTEHGPFRLEEGADGEPYPILYNESWNKIASVLYVEMPTGVGFSFSEDTSHYKNITDAEASHDTFHFLLAFFKVFSQFKPNPFYVTGESYGGHYVPTLCTRILDEPNEMNMKGFLIGNPGINSDWYYNVNEYAFVTFMWSHGLIPQPAYAAAVKACKWDTFQGDCAKDFTHPTIECKAATMKATKYIPSPLDPYDVLAPTCQPGDGTRSEGDAFVSAYTPQLDALRKANNLSLSYDPCIKTFTNKYMNQPAVLKAIHADKGDGRKWPEHPRGWKYDEGPAGAKNDIALLFPHFFEKAANWSIAVVSGTADAAVPFIGTERWMNCLGRPVKNDFRPWKLNGDVAGMIKDYDQMSFVTVKGCGHTIPTYCPEAGYAFFANWIQNSWD
jgi:carboxypeptidase C (cathepsin A)